ncbi:MAG: 2Fe-2S iron-sulfur cluster binding domain-containing protein [Candidatus Woesearchaeota archaeon]
MAKIIKDDESKEIKDGDAIRNACEELGVPFGCNEGICGTCKIKVLEGRKNLSEPSEREKEYGIDLEGGERLACQCRIKKGEIKIDF